MAIIAGIDEAGFGPKLGPLVVSGVAFKVPDDRVEGCLWKMLRSSCARKITKKGRRLVIADSKQLYHCREDLHQLERPLLVLLGASGKNPRTWRGLLDEISPEASPQLDGYPWYSINDFPIPAGDGVGDIPTRTNAMRRDLGENEIELSGIFCDPVPEGHFNGLVDKIGNKSSLVMGRVLRLVDRILNRCTRGHVRICVDHLGGRVRYREPLQTAFPQFALEIVDESPNRSAYRLRDQSKTVDIDFTVKGEEHSFCIALASMCSKYVRELYMRSFNDYWCRQHDGLKPTAGYYGDADRWLKDAAPALKRLSIDHKSLVRSR